MKIRLVDYGTRLEAFPADSPIDTTEAPLGHAQKAGRQDSWHGWYLRVGDSSCFVTTKVDAKASLKRLAGSALAESASAPAELSEDDQIDAAIRDDVIAEQTLAHMRQLDERAAVDQAATVEARAVDPTGDAIEAALAAVAAAAVTPPRRRSSGLPACSGSPRSSPHGRPRSPTPSWRCRAPRLGGSS